LLLRARVAADALLLLELPGVRVRLLRVQRGVAFEGQYELKSTTEAGVNLGVAGVSSAFPLCVVVLRGNC
jgi:hypothetical protein